MRTPRRSPEGSPRPGRGRLARNAPLDEETHRVGLRKLLRRCGLGRQVQRLDLEDDLTRHAERLATGCEQSNRGARREERHRELGRGATRCSQLSSTISSSRRPRLHSRKPRAEACCPSNSDVRMPSASATASGTRAGSRRGASSTSQTPSRFAWAAIRATSRARLVFPTPPGPVSVTSRCSAMLPSTSEQSSSRPTRLVSRAPMFVRSGAAGASSDARCSICRSRARDSSSGSRPSSRRRWESVR